MSSYSRRSERCWHSTRRSAADSSIQHSISNLLAQDLLHCQQGNTGRSAEQSARWSQQSVCRVSAPPACRKSRPSPAPTPPRRSRCLDRSRTCNAQKRGISSVRCVVSAPDWQTRPFRTLKSRCISRVVCCCAAFTSMHFSNAEHRARSEMRRIVMRNIELAVKPA